jgi:methylated-DNA-[protein]-cysteine S-methyltransferase
MKAMQSAAVVYCTKFDSPLGPMLATAECGALSGLYFTGQRWFPQAIEDWREDDAAQPFAALRRQLDAYWSGTLREFDLPLAPAGADGSRATQFQCDVWKAIRAVPLGTTIAYGALATAAGKASAVRAAGAATGRNPISLVIPCHRIVGSDGSLTGYAGGIERKRTLLEFESAAAHAMQDSTITARPIAHFIAAGRSPVATARMKSATIPFPL